MTEWIVLSQFLFPSQLSNALVSNLFPVILSRSLSLPPSHSHTQWQSINRSMIDYITSLRLYHKAQYLNHSIKKEEEEEEDMLHLTHRQIHSWMHRSVRTIIRNAPTTATTVNRCSNPRGICRCWVHGATGQRARRGSRPRRIPTIRARDGDRKRIRGWGVIAWIQYRAVGSGGVIVTVIGTTYQKINK